MQTTHPLGQLSALQQMMTQLLEPLSDRECRHSYHPSLAPLLWDYGRAVYLETWLLRQQIQGETDITDRVADIFTPGALPPETQWERLPPKDHLLNWALELQDENLMRLANLDRLPDHPLLAENRLILLINQSRALLYEQMLQTLVEQRLQQAEAYRVVRPLIAEAPTADQVGVSQGHYRIGAKGDPAARDNEQPAQVVNLSNFRIDRQPASNAAWLAFMQAGGYAMREYWSEQGWGWRQGVDSHPHHWRRDNHGAWYGMSLNGPADLLPEDPVMGISQHEAQAYARWVASLGGELSGAVLQHEYQWEVALRTRAVKTYGRIWEWCANPFEAYSEFQPGLDPEGGIEQFAQGHYVLRGGCLHSQPSIRRLSFRHHAAAGDRTLFAGTRLVFPPKEQ
ncbi:SUMF1/EgtB/PvdO family nonheme iron enzyme [Sedimenticola selenatireducens]|uniref:SUMF1/EgtB/PvdO family nonheme iron enzyme n=1 Tax=Sedimenticola selenatireducens TaxID=191960 RepID=UPI002AAAF5C9|nr:SUMF1/EgtB/PvdO family nonheme iron enzyme [Sedimenticola selenatireducens]